MLRNREFGKNKCRSVGPYWFVRYEGKLSTQAIIVNVKGQERVVSVTNLLPIRAPAHRMLRFMPGQLPPSQPASPFNSSSDSEPEYEGDGLPRDAIVVPSSGKGLE